MTTGPLLFASPLALAALLALPALWWLLRMSPPPPQRTLFPPTRLLLGLRTEEQSRERAPLWLVIFRALAAALMILAFARPSLAPSAASGPPGGRTLIVIDDGWTSAPFWSQTRAAALAAAAAAERAHVPVFLLLTAPDTRARDPGEALTAADAKARIARLEPKPWRPDRADAAARLARVSGGFDRIVWISDGLDDPGAQALAGQLQRRGPVTARLPARTARALIAASVTPQGVEIQARRASNGAGEAAIAAETLEGRALGAAPLRFAGDSQTASARIALPPEIAARAARVRIVGEASAGAVRLMPAGAGRPFVGLADSGGESQSLLSELFYAERALSPYASLQRGGVGALIDARAQALILPDSVRLAPGERAALERWLETGGLLVRFAGPRLANAARLGEAEAASLRRSLADDLLPVRFRPGLRALGGALAWESPLAIAAFAPDSPFSGLTPPADVSVHRQVLAEPASLETARVWASLSDNSPLVTAQPRGRGLIVLYHVSAGPDWSDLPLSGVFVEMLRRTLAFAGRAGGAGERDIAGGPFAPQRLLDGYGALTPAPAEARPIAPESFALAQPSAATPPGLYERAGISAAIDAARADEQLAPLRLPNAIVSAGLDGAIERPLSGYLFAFAAMLLAADLIVALVLLGKFPLPPRRAARLGEAEAASLRRSLAAIGLMLALAAAAADAQAQPRDDPTQVLRLAYVRTGEARIDRISAAGLDALTQTLINRTSVEPGAPVGVDLTRDDLSAYPFLYWPAPSSPRRLSDAALANLGRYLAIGGLLLVDTRDAERVQTSSRPAALMLAGVDAPPLEQVTGAHIAARAFYLLSAFPGRTQTSRLWAESAAAAASRDGVAALFVGDGDWAAAWAGEASLDGGPRQREMALRFGVNLVMVALTGNYKADQVHVPALLERLGDEGRR